VSSFSSEVKNELARHQPDKECCQRAELMALLRMSGRLLIGGRGTLGLTIITENAGIARKILTLLKKQFHIPTETMVRKNRRLKKHNTYVLRVPPCMEGVAMLKELGMIDNDNSIVDSDRGLWKKSCCRRAYLRGVFQGGGSVSKPAGDYHLELVTDNDDFGKALVKLLQSFDLQAGVSSRKQDCVIYLKGADQITSFLNIVGAHNALFDFENARVVKEMRNRVNRLVNCETANLEKTVNAALRQVENIRFLAQTGILSRLSRVLQEIAHIRLQYPEASLQELVELSGGKVGKSGINHRLRKLEQIADEHLMEQKDSKGL
jgi:cell division protein WhiA